MFSFGDWSTDFHGTGGCYRPAIDTLPDDIFLEIFAHCVPHYGFMGMGIDISNHMSRWKCLVQVCRRWRQLIYGSPRYLDLILYCSRTEGIPVKHLSYWPALPIAVCSCIPDGLVNGTQRLYLVHA